MSAPQIARSNGGAEMAQSGRPRDPVHGGGGVSQISTSPMRIRARARCGLSRARTRCRGGCGQLELLKYQSDAEKALTSSRRGRPEAGNLNADPRFKNRLWLGSGLPEGQVPGMTASIVTPPSATITWPVMNSGGPASTPPRRRLLRHPIRRIGVFALRPYVLALSPHIAPREIGS